MENILKKFVDSRNNEGRIIAAFGYGSGIFKQKGYSLQEKPMIDTIFVVENPLVWHRENIKNHPDDYSKGARIILKYFNLNAIKKATGVTYQCGIPFQGQTFKYGIISEERFIDAMWGNWDSFFIQGRFQKPTYTIVSNDSIDKAIKENHDLALFVALLTLDVEHPTLTDLYTQICSLSYQGDIRMYFAENPNKVKNIVEGSFKQFYEMYGDHNIFFTTGQDGELIINYDLLYSSLSSLPETLYDYIEKQKCPLKNRQLISILIKKKLAQINRKDSLIQPSFGLLTVGTSRAAEYFKRKVKKKNYEKS